MIEVKDHSQTTHTYIVHTDAEYLIDAMKDAQKLTFSGYEGPYGFTLVSVNGTSADWEKDNAYWSILVNGEYATTGASEIPVYDGNAYTLEYTALG